MNWPVFLILQRDMQRDVGKLTITCVDTLSCFSHACEVKIQNTTTENTKRGTCMILKDLNLLDKICFFKWQTDVFMRGGLSFFVCLFFKATDALKSLKIPSTLKCFFFWVCPLKFLTLTLLTVSVQSLSTDRGFLMPLLVMSEVWRCLCASLKSEF